MTNKELLEKIARLETELAEVKEMAEAMKKRVDGDGLFKPKDEQVYWSIMSGGEASEEWWYDNLFDHDRYSIGNCFRNEQEAEGAVRVLKLIQKARESQNGFVPDWGNSEQRKYYLYFDDNGTWTGTNFSESVTPIFGYWGDKSECDKFAKDNHGELIWFFTEYKR